ncbi:hypothetical protein VIGAN_03263400 [Vigna angularis var. angularis]|uniref:Uncharacterized protein n=1 Tax=Vigna angularis var. angularis TaxID=157739 RepID=A0A0S3RPS7_PHAAN|nr:hypothetical protein VIGAN_03263400 [Vigna angularis var. angularis]
MFQNIMQDIVCLTMFVNPPVSSVLNLYVIVSYSTTSLVLVLKENKNQKSNYFESNSSTHQRASLGDQKTCPGSYLFLARLCQHFQSFDVVVYIDNPIQRAL